ncbi:MAG TPA: DUF2804 family protein [Acidimicrobiales bacterium]|nr:DUF2804 family protein [Acidimicrobiales bacterium]
MIVQPWRAPATEPAAATPRPGPSGAGRPVDAPAAPPGSGGATIRPALPLPPAPMPRQSAGRPLKRWCYVGMFGPELMLCAGSAWVGPLAQSFWAVWDRRSGLLDTESAVLRPGRIRVSAKAVTVRSGSTRLELAVTSTGQPVEVVSPHGRSYIWTRKTPVRVDGHLTLGMEARPVSGLGLLDESAGYHARHTEWEWSAGVGTTVDGWPVTWNLVRGVHDAETMSERTVWLHGRPAEVPPVRFGRDLDELWATDGSVLRFEEEAARRRSDNLGLVRSDYVQPFGRFSGTLPGGYELSRSEPALGVMERHRARW